VQSEVRSLRNQLLRWLLMPVLLLLALDGAIAYGLALKYANTAYDRALFDTALTLAGQVRVQDLDRDPSAEHVVGSLPHLGHAAGTDHALEAVASAQDGSSERSRCR